MQQRDVAPPPWSEIRRSGAPGWPALQREGEAAAAVLREKLIDHALPPDLAARGGRVLDFGAGSGSIALARAMLPTDACDMSEAAMDHLAAVLPGVRCVACGSAPPLPFADETFDAVYAGSAWCRLPPSAGLLWLAEIARIMKPGALALISVCGPDGVDRRRATARPGWTAIDSADLARLGAVFLPLDAGPLGFTAYSHRTILDTFDPVLRVEAIYAGILADAQDLVVLRRPASPSRNGARRLSGRGQIIWRRLAGGWRRPG